MSTYSKNRHKDVCVSLTKMTNKRIKFGTILDDGYKVKWESVDITGLTFGKLKGIRPVGHTTRHGLTWLMKCECGEDVTRPTAGLNKVSSCGCANLIDGIKSGHAINAMYWDYKNSASRRGHKFELSLLEFRILTSGDCYYCGESPSKIRKSNYGNYVYNGIDRVDNKVGYVAHNCVPCCTRCNFSKRDFSSEDFINMVDSVYKNTHKFDRALKVS
jgi:hypothetical protein